MFKKMKKKIVVTGIIAMVVVAMLGVGVAYAFNVSGADQTGTVSVKEAISCVYTSDTLPGDVIYDSETNTMTVDMYPNETGDVTYTLSNAGSADIAVTVDAAVTDSGDVTVLPATQTVTVGGHGSATFNVTLAATAGADPAVSHDLTIDVSR